MSCNGMLILQDPMSLLVGGWELDYWQIQEVYQIVSKLTPIINIESDLITELTAYSLLLSTNEIVSGIYPIITLNLPFFERVVRY